MNCTFNYIICCFNKRNRRLLRGKHYNIGSSGITSPVEHLGVRRQPMTMSYVSSCSVELRKLISFTVVNGFQM